MLSTLHQDILMRVPQTTFQNLGLCLNYGFTEVPDKYRVR